jgi:hypothetical protein
VFYDQAGYWSPEPHHVLTCHFKFDEEQLLCNKSTVIEPNRQFKIISWDQCFSVKELESLLESHGFRLLSCFSDITGTTYNDASGKIALVAVKR